MAKRKSGVTMEHKLFLFVLGAMAAGFVGGFVFARDRYVDKIASISEMNMQKAVAIDELNQQIQVLGASDSVDEE